MAQSGKAKHNFPHMMRKRAEFLSARNGARATACALRCETHITDESRDHPRIGFTVTKKNGNAVKRNRIKRRMRGAIQSIKNLKMRNGNDYVLIAKPNALTVPFVTLQSDIADLIRKSHKRLDTTPAAQNAKPDV
ncbi:ribonuclease P protein component [Ahrensia sp. 13_GOM-1096m]|uniref:ribonuclease P protein component n=1 Tax=Ahrensia sp. 13_GOM-1096m TaxID=1380380 RepID=UPI000688402E|nr:ribonuclease P protein component [Ahrensia sp. 13_GOM-1096m]